MLLPQKHKDVQSQQFADNQNSELNIEFNECGYMDTWRRPLYPHIEQVMKKFPARYEINSFIQAREDICYFFTSTGLSLEGDILNLSGLDIVPEHYFCSYLDGSRLTDGNSAELWIMYFKVRKLIWTGEDYLAIVEPKQSGVQFIEFPRHERMENPTIRLELLNKTLIGEYQPIL